MTGEVERLVAPQLDDGDSAEAHHSGPLASASQARWM